MRTRPLLLAALLAATLAHADPQLTSWHTAGSAKYARIVETDAELAAGTTKTTWTRTSGPNTIAQSLPVYAGPQQIDTSASWVYVRTPNLATYVMGPWYNNAAKTALFVNIPKNQGLIIRIPRSSTLGSIPTTKTRTQGLNVSGVMQDAVGWLVDGTAVFDPLDGFAYSNGTESSPSMGEWHRDAYVNEGITFDKSYAHQQNTGKYHHHANPIALRYQLGDAVSYSSTTKSYSETLAPTQHSPILGWMLDGLPVYGPYGYSSALDASSGVRRMIGGYVKRDGATTGVDNISTTGSARALPAWALRNNGNISTSGPNVSTTYPFGRYIEDWAYLGDLIKTGTTKYAQGTDFDLNEYNVRYCVTPEFPSGTWAYFLNITSAGVPQFPYMINRWFYGTPTGGMISSVSETVTNQFKGGANTALTIPTTPTVSSGNVSLTWASVEGGTYAVDASSNNATWTSKATGVVATDATTTRSYTALGSSGTEYARVQRTALATYDTTGTTTATVAQTASTSFNLGNTPPTISSIANQTSSQSTAGPVSFTIGDTETAAASLTVSGTSSNTSVVANAGLSFGGSGANRTVTIARAAFGTSTLTLSVNDGTDTTTTTFTITFIPQITTPSALFPSYVGASDVDETFEAPDLTTPTWSVDSGAMPTGLSVEASTGNVLGNPSAAGTFTFTIRAQDATYSITKAFTWIIEATGVSIATTSLTDGTAGSSYSFTLAATGGDGVYTWSLPGSPPPTGITLSSAGVVSGIPATAGATSFVVLCRDSIGLNSSKSFVLTINANPLSITTSSLATAVKNVGYSQTLAISGGTAPYTWSTNSGTWPVGITLSSAGVVSGTPTVTGTFDVVVQVTDKALNTLTKALSLTVSASYLKPVMNAVSLGTTTVGASFASTVSATNYPKTYTITGLPSGLTYVSTTGVISGRAKVSGAFNVQVKATNTAGTSETVTASLLVKALPSYLVGSFMGYVLPEPSATFSPGGMLSLTTTSAGTFTAKITQLGKTSTATGYLNTSAPHINVSVGTKTLQLNLLATNVGFGTYGSAITEAWRSAWNTSTHPASGHAGYYSIGITLRDAMDDGVITVPQGDGYATFTVSTAGTLTVSGKTADGQAITTAGFIGQDGQLLVFSSHYSNQGGIEGRLTLTQDANGDVSNNICSGMMLWFKPATTTRTYAAGFGVTQLDAYGKYLAPASTGNVILGLPTAGSTALSFTDGGLSLAALDPDVPAFTYTSTNTVTMPTAGSAANPAKATLTINKNTGAVSGTFTLVDGTQTRKVTYQGQVVRPASGTSKAKGYYLLPQIPLSGETSSTSPMLSGGVLISQ